MVHEIDSRSKNSKPEPDSTGAENNDVSDNSSSKRSRSRPRTSTSGAATNDVENPENPSKRRQKDVDDEEAEAKIPPKKRKTNFRKSDTENDNSNDQKVIS